MRLVANDWASDRCASLHQFIVCADDRERSPRLYRSRTPKHQCITMKIIGAGFCDNVYGAACRPAILGGGRVRQDRDFLHRGKRKTSEKRLPSPTIVSGGVV